MWYCLDYAPSAQWSDALHNVTLHPTEPTTAYATKSDYSDPDHTVSQLMKATDLGSDFIWGAIPPTWTSIYTFTNQVDPWKFWISEVNPDIMYTASYGGLGGYSSSDGGYSWITWDDPAFELTEIIHLSRANAQIVYGYSNVIGAPHKMVIYKSTDGCQSWTDITPPLPPGQLGYTSGDHPHITTDPNDSQVIYLWGLKYESPFGAAPIFKSTDGGSTWSSISLSSWNFVSIDIIEIDADDSNTLYVAGRKLPSSPWVLVVNRSLDGGSTWTQLFDTYYLNPVITYLWATSMVLVKWDGLYKTLIVTANKSAPNYSAIVVYLNVDEDVLTKNAYTLGSSATFRATSVTRDGRLNMQCSDPQFNPITSDAFVVINPFLTIEGTVYHDAVDPGNVVYGASINLTDTFCTHSNSGLPYQVGNGYSREDGTYTMFVPYGSSSCMYVLPLSPYIFRTGSSYTNITTNLTGYDFVGETTTMPGDMTVCHTGTSVLGAISPLDGVWSGTGITDPSGIFSADVAGVGVHEVYCTWEQTVCGVTEPLLRTIHITVPDAPAGYLDVFDCKLLNGIPITITASSINLMAPMTFEWYEDDVLVQSALGVDNYTTLGYIDETHVYYCHIIDVNGCEVDTPRVTIVWDPVTITSTSPTIRQAFWAIGFADLFATEGYTNYDWYESDVPVPGGNVTLVQSGPSNQFRSYKTCYYSVVATDDMANSYSSSQYEVNIAPIPCYTATCATASIPWSPVPLLEAGYPTMNVSIDASEVSGDAPLYVRLLPVVTGGSGFFTYNWTVQVSPGSVYTYDIYGFSFTFICAASPGDQFVNLTVTDTITNLSADAATVYITTLGDACP